MTLEKAFDPAALIAALKTVGVADAEKVVSDCLPIVFDWLNTSVHMAVPAPYGIIASTVLSELENGALAELNSLEAKI